MKNLSTAARRKHATRITALKAELNRALYKRWVIQYQWKPGHCTGHPHDWRSWRRFARVPILFHSREEAEEYLKIVGFRGFEKHRKVSASVEVRWLKEKAV